MPNNQGQGAGSQKSVSAPFFWEKRAGSRSWLQQSAPRARAGSQPRISALLGVFELPQKRTEKSRKSCGSFLGSAPLFFLGADMELTPKIASSLQKRAERAAALLWERLRSFFWEPIWSWFHAVALRAGAGSLFLKLPAPKIAGSLPLLKMGAGWVELQGGRTKRHVSEVNS